MEPTARTSIRVFLREAWSIAKPYWFGDDRRAGRGLLAVIVALNLGMVWLLVKLNQWNAAFYDSLQNKDMPEFWHQLGIFCVIAFSYIAAAVYHLYLNQMLQIRWRRWMTDHSLERWLGERAYYRMQLADRGTDNPDQRITEDVKMFVTLTLRLGLDLLRQVVTLFSFLFVLYSLSGVLELTLAGHGIHVPGYMLYAAILYAIVGSWLTTRIGRPLTRLNFEQQRYEADFRFGLVRFRENAEGVALYGGEGDERRRFGRQFGEVVRNWWEIMKAQKRLMWFTTGYGQAAVVFPFIMAAPRYFSGAIQLGGLMQTASAFGRVQDALSYLVDSYTDIAEWRAVVERLAGFRHATESARSEAVASTGIARAVGAPTRLAIEGLTLKLPDGRPLLQGAHTAFRAGESVLVSGPSGTGKSTFFRALAGIWPFGAGRVEVPEGARTLFLPQKPYLPIATLRDVLLYPGGAAQGVDDATIRATLEAVGLPAFASRLDEDRHWALELSGGEQQRIAFARALLQRPDWLFLDEATSALDEATEGRLYALLRERLPETTVVSIGHRGTLGAYHARRLVFDPGAAGGGLGGVEEPATAAR
ncbi:MAG TPA: ABC transporter ATP-binding protein/permease [Myxococcota bacterium]|jgi:putative ATP-binding cassette transporter|nr:ABC transporter ATP-binding protein/permease [Myxococcota bacterium]